MFSKIVGGSLRLLERDGRPLAAEYFAGIFMQSFQYIPGEQFVLLSVADPDGTAGKNYLVPLPLRNADRNLSNWSDNHHPLLNIAADMDMDLNELSRIDSSPSQAAMDLDPYVR